MIVLNRRDGKTEQFDLGIEADARKLNGIGNDPRTASAVTGFSLKIEGRSTTLPAPKRFRRVSFFGALLRDGDGKSVGEQLTVEADDVEIRATMWHGAESSKIEIWKRGRRVFTPDRKEAP